MLNFIPKTILGKWSTCLILIFFFSLSIFYIFIALGQRGGETFFSNLFLTIPMLFATTCAIASFFTGIISIFRDKEKSFLLFFSVLIGFFVLLFCFCEIIFPH